MCKKKIISALYTMLFSFKVRKYSDKKTDIIALLIVFTFNLVPVFTGKQNYISLRGGNQGH